MLVITTGAVCKRGREGNKLSSFIKKRKKNKKTQDQEEGVGEESLVLQEEDQLLLSL